MYKSDLFFKTDPELLSISQKFAEDNSLFLETVSESWQLLMNADMFDGPNNNMCSTHLHSK